MPKHEETANLGQLDALGKRLAGGEGDLPEMEERQAPGFLKFFPVLVQEFWARKAYFKMEEDGSLAMEGFYKNGPMRLEIREGGKLVAVDKRNRQTPIESFDDLVELNFSWWKASNTKTTYVEPARPWADEFIERKWVRKKIIYQPREPDTTTQE